MMDKHTPAPWNATDFRSGNWKIWDVVTEDKNPVCVVSTPKIEQTPEALEEFEANARLIAAAPEMKEALQRLDIAVQAWWKAEPGLIPEAVQVVEAGREANAIIDRLKARGGGDE